MEKLFPLFGYTEPRVAVARIFGRIGRVCMPQAPQAPSSKPGLRVVAPRKRAPMFPPTRKYAIASQGGYFEHHSTWIV